METITLTL